MNIDDFQSHFLRLDDRGDVLVVGFTLSHINDEENIEQLGRELVTLIEQYEKDHIVLDLTDVEYVTSSVIGKIIALHRRINRSEGRLVICNVGESIENILTTASLLRYFNVSSDVESAVATFGAED